MHGFLREHEVACPSCWETVALEFDLSVEGQSYIEDCPVCCRPMTVSYTVVDGELESIDIVSAE
jgi:Cysteine-rich CPXCG